MRVEQAERLRAMIETRSAPRVKTSKWAETTIEFGFTLNGDQAHAVECLARKLVLAPLWVRPASMRSIWSATDEPS